MRVAVVVLALTAVDCASHAAQAPRLDPAVAATVCAPNPDVATAKRGGCLLKNQAVVPETPPQ
jgi:hypothetical protein